MSEKSIFFQFLLCLSHTGSSQYPPVLPLDSSSPWAGVRCTPVCVYPSDFGYCQYLRGSSQGCKCCSMDRTVPYRMSEAGPVGDTDEEIYCTELACMTVGAARPGPSPQGWLAWRAGWNCWAWAKAAVHRHNLLFFSEKPHFSFEDLPNDLVCSMQIIWNHLLPLAILHGPTQTIFPDTHICSW